MINNQELLTALIALIIRIVERVCACKRGLETLVTAIRVVRIYLVNGSEVY